MKPSAERDSRAREIERGEHLSPHNSPSTFSFLYSLETLVRTCSYLIFREGKNISFFCLPLNCLLGYPNRILGHYIFKFWPHQQWTSQNIQGSSKYPLSTQKAMRTNNQVLLMTIASRGAPSHNSLRLTIIKHLSTFILEKLLELSKGIITIELSLFVQLQQPTVIICKSLHWTSLKQMPCMTVQYLHSILNALFH